MISNRESGSRGVEDLGPVGGVVCSHNAGVSVQIAGE